MAEKINIASLTIDLDDVVKESVKLKKQLDAVKDSQNELKKSGDKSSAAFVENEIKIKQLSKAYRDNQSFATALDSANKDLEKTMSIENKSTQELRDSRSQLNQISKNIKGDTEEEIELRTKLNKAIDSQTEVLREQSSEFNESKDKIGEYKNGILEAVEELRKQQEVLYETREALEANRLELKEGSEEYENVSQALVVVNSDLKKVNDSLGEGETEFKGIDLSVRGFLNSANEAGGATNLLKDGLGAAKTGMISFTKSTIAFLATPVGIVLAAIAGAFLLIKNAMNRSEESTAKVKSAFGAFSGIAKQLLKFLQPLGDFLIDGLVKGFELVEKGLFAALGAIQKGLSYLGFDEAAKSVGEFNKKIEESAEAGKTLVKAELDLAKAQRISKKIQLEYQREAEKLRQIRDDETKSIPERLKANAELGALLKKQGAEEVAIAQKALDLILLRMKLEGETTDLLNQRAEAETEIADIQERITGQMSEQLTNRVSLQKEAAEKAIAIQEAELDKYLKSQEVRAKTLEEGLQVEKEAAEKKIKILDAELKAKLITQAEYDAEVLGIKNDLLKSQAELTADHARRELQDYIQKNESKLDSEKYLTEEIFNEEKTRLERLAEQRRNFAKVQFDEGLINQTEYNQAINEINEENRLSNEELEKEREEAKKEKLAIDAENRLILLEEQTASDYEALTARLEAERLAEVAAAEKTGANLDLINKKYSGRQKAIDDELNETKLKGYSETFGGIAELLGEHTAAGKAAGIAAATINTYQGITEVWKAPSVLPEPFNTITKGVATGVTLASGLSSVRKIASTPTKYSKGDILKGKSHASGGIPFLLNGQAGFEAEGGESLINKKSTSMFAPLLSAINVAGGGKKFASGDVLGSVSRSSSVGLIDYDLLSTKLSEANASLPTPVVSVEEISTVSNNVAVIEDIATL